MRWCVLGEVFGFVCDAWTSEVVRGNVLVRELRVWQCVFASSAEGVHSVGCGRAGGVGWVYILGGADSGWTGS